MADEEPNVNRPLGVATPPVNEQPPPLRHQDQTVRFAFEGVTPLTPVISSLDLLFGKLGWGGEGFSKKIFQSASPPLRLWYLLKISLECVQFDMIA